MPAGIAPFKPGVFEAGLASALSPWPLNLLCVLSALERHA